MPSPVVLAVATLNHNTGIPKDADQNSFVFTSEDTSALALAGALAAYSSGAGILHAFYSVVGSGMTHPVDWYLSPCLSRVANACMVEYFDITGHLDGSAHGSPILTQRMSLNATMGAATGLPSQDCAVLTVHDGQWAAAAVDGPTVTTIPTPHRAQVEGAPPTHSGKTRPKQRHSGRIYIGPLNGAALTDDGNAEALLTNGAITDFAAAGHALIVAPGTLTVPTWWSHWSRANAQVSPIVGGWCDNRIDIERRRQLLATSRHAFS